ncbi:MAG: hypothetical protein KKA60_03160 [Proteobacteria bacterium]|nr:hypothetical protein [Pseudomonadota bacterium]
MKRLLLIFCVCLLTVPGAGLAGEPGPGDTAPVKDGGENAPRIARERVDALEARAASLTQWDQALAGAQDAVARITPALEEISARLPLAGTSSAAREAVTGRLDKEANIQAMADFSEVARLRGAEGRQLSEQAAKCADSLQGLLGLTVLTDAGVMKRIASENPAMAEMLAAQGGDPDGMVARMALTRWLSEAVNDAIARSAQTGEAILAERRRVAEESGQTGFGLSVAKGELRRVTGPGPARPEGAEDAASPMAGAPPLDESPPENAEW